VRAIIIDDKDAKALLDQLKLESFTSSPFGANTVGILERGGISRNEYHMIVNDIHSRFHYIVTRWLQDQGASTI
jgi:hypothetical protein